MSIHVWLPFFLTTILVSLSPGPGALAAMSAGLAHGFRRGHAVTFGLALGVCTQLLVVGMGMGALLAASPAAFSVVKWAGAAYLVYLGVQQWRSRASPLAGPASPAASETHPATAPQAIVWRALLVRGWTVNALNPKGTVFLLAVLPQFVDMHSPLAPQYAVIAATFAAVEFVVMTGYVALASRLLRLLRTPAQMRWLNRSFGSVFVVAGAALAGFSRAA